MPDGKCTCEKCEGYQKYLAWKAEQRNQPESPPVATTYTKSYVSGEFGDTSKPLEYVTLKAGDRELAILPLREIAHMANDLREEIERYRMDHKPDTRHRFVPNKKYPWFCRDCGYPPEHPVMHIPAAAGLDSENVQGMARRDGRPPCEEGLSPSPSPSCSPLPESPKD